MPPPDAGTGFVLLAAGRSARFDGNKLEADFCGRPLWEWSVLAAEAAGFAHRFVVNAPDRPLGPRRGWTFVENMRAEAGLGSSIAAGVAAAGMCSRIVFALADMPLVTAHHLSRLADARGVVFTRYPDGAHGIPAAFPGSAYARLAELGGDRGAGALDFAGATTFDPFDPGMLADVDTPADLEELAGKV